MTEALRDTIRRSIKETKGVKLSHEEAGYHAGHGPGGSHCGICEYFLDREPSACKKVVPPISPDDGCKLFEPKD